jgi:hypothetical protein
VECSDFTTPEECKKGMEKTGTSGKCEMYDDTCRVKCSEFLDEDDCQILGTDYCFWLKGGAGLEDSCVDKVC